MRNEPGGRAPVETAAPGSFYVETAAPGSFYVETAAPGLFYVDTAAPGSFYVGTAAPGCPGERSSSGSGLRPDAQPRRLCPRVHQISQQPGYT